MHLSFHTIFKIQKYVFHKYNVFEEYDYVFVEYDWPKGKYAHTCLKLLLDERPQSVVNAVLQNSALNLYFSVWDRNIPIVQSILARR